MATQQHEITTRRRWLRPLLGLGVTLAIAVQMFLGQWATFRAMPRNLLRGDFALIAMRLHGIGNRAVELGPFSRFGWMHPGPLLFYLLAVSKR